MSNLDLFKNSGAEFSPCRKYRYKLWRIWDKAKPYVLFLMLNPSTADDIDNDPTVERCERRALKMGDYGGIKVANIFAFRATDPSDMKAQADPVGPENDAAIKELAGNAGLVICAWGNHGHHMGRSTHVRALLKEIGIKPYMLALTSAGEPNHPLYVSYNTEPQEFPIDL